MKCLLRCLLVFLLFYSPFLSATKLIKHYQKYNCPFWERKGECPFRPCCRWRHGDAGPCQAEKDEEGKNRKQRELEEEEREKQEAFKKELAFVRAGSVPDEALRYMPHCIPLKGRLREAYDRYLAEEAVKENSKEEEPKKESPEPAKKKEKKKRVAKLGKKEKPS